MEKNLKIKQIILILAASMTLSSANLLDIEETWGGYVHDDFDKSYTAFFKNMQSNNKEDAFVAGMLLMKPNISVHYRRDGGAEGKPNFIEAEKWLQKAAELGSAEAAYNLAYFYLTEDEMQGTQEKYHHYLDRAKALGYRDAYFLSLREASRYEQYFGVSCFSLAYRDIQTIYQQSPTPEVAVMLGQFMMAYIEGKVTEKLDPTIAKEITIDRVVEVLESAFQQGKLSPAVTLVKIYEQGIGGYEINRNRASAIKEKVAGQLSKIREEMESIYATAPISIFSLQTLKEANDLLADLFANRPDLTDRLANNVTALEIFNFASSFKRYEGLKYLTSINHYTLAEKEALLPLVREGLANNDGYSTYLMGKLYLSVSRREERDIETATLYLLKAAHLGEVEAVKMLLNGYENGDYYDYDIGSERYGIVIDQNSAYEWNRILLEKSPQDVSQRLMERQNEEAEESFDFDPYKRRSVFKDMAELLPEDQKESFNRAFENNQIQEMVEIIDDLNDHNAQIELNMILARYLANNNHNYDQLPVLLAEKSLQLIEESSRFSQGKILYFIATQYLNSESIDPSNETNAIKYFKLAFEQMLKEEFYGKKMTNRNGEIYLQGGDFEKLSEYFFPIANQLIYGGFGNTLTPEKEALGVQWLEELALYGLSDIGEYLYQYFLDRDQLAKAYYYLELYDASGRWYSGGLFDHLPDEERAAIKEDAHGIGLYFKYINHIPEMVDLKKRADAGDKDALTMLGLTYFEGEITAPKIIKALRYYLIMEWGGHAAEYNRQGNAHRKGINTPVDMEKSLYYFDLGAQLNDSNCAHQAGDLLYLGEGGLEKDYAKALEYFAQTNIEDGNHHALAKYKMASIYYFGKGNVPQDKQKAYDLLKQYQKYDNSDEQRFKTALEQWDFTDVK